MKTGLFQRVVSLLDLDQQQSYTVLDFGCGNGEWVRFDRRAHLPIVLASGLLDTPVDVPWWNGMRLRLTA